MTADPKRMGRPRPLARRQFASDNYAGITPEAWRALAEANSGHAAAYGDDEWSARVTELVRGIFETDCEVFFAFNGTAANAMALASLCRSYNSVICHELAHIQTDECGAPEFFSGGLRLLPVGGDHAKVDAVEVECLAASRDGDVHFSKAGALSITQATELGAVYTPDELGAIAEVARRAGLALHMDGARFANALAALGCRAREITWDKGVEVLSLGGTKLGMPVGDLVVFFNRDRAVEFEYRRKQAGQLASKMRFLAAPWVGMLEDGAWLAHAAHANRQADRLSRALGAVDGVELLVPTQANAVFVRLSGPVRRALHETGWVFMAFIGDDGVRLMCSWDTTDEDVDDFVRDLKDCVGAAGPA